MPFLNQPDQPAQGGKIQRFEGVSEYRDESGAESLHEAIQQAAHAAAEAFRLSPENTRIFEVTRIQVEVGNPNVKVYRVEIE